MLCYLKSSLDHAKVEYEVSDLYAMNFKTDMDEQEYEREGFANYTLPIPDDVKAEHNKIEWQIVLFFSIRFGGVIVLPNLKDGSTECIQ